MAHLTIADDEIQLAARAAERVTQLIGQAVRERGHAIVALTGGTTPRRLYSNLADPSQPWRDRIPWTDVHLFWGDERHVPPEHPDSNYGMAHAALIDHVPIPPDHVHRMHGEMPDAHAAATEYDGVLSAFSRTTLFDLMLLGLGEDAHIASIFPGSDLLNRGNPHRVAAVWAEHLRVWRITLTPEAILDSHAIDVLVAGEKKAAAVRAALRDPLDVQNIPAQLLRSAGDRVEWLLDRAAASRIDALVDGHLK
jgi:6-phosphogluconolactonase